MKKMWKPLAATLMVAAVLSCNNAQEAAKDEAAKPVDSAKATVKVDSPAAPAFKPFYVIEIVHTVKDYAKWRPAFNSDSMMRKAAGLTDLVVGRNDANPNALMVVLQVSDTAKAKAFSGDPRLKEVMAKAGVISKPDVHMFQVIRFDAGSNEKHWITVTHKVKDFDAWLKVFDGEGSAARKEQGLIDVALARGVEDPNMVHIVFDVKEMAKAKAAIMSEEKKKLMASAGVEGKPMITFYTTGD
ncbi:MAG: hypothetical protein KGO82_02215 [Bacteroidota bacterium]|nr:hypothetical protein [Bacteroidota bacterium]